MGISFGQTNEELKQLNKLLSVGDTLFEQRKYQEALKIYERAYKLCECSYPYEQIRYIKDSNLIIRNKKNKGYEKD